MPTYNFKREAKLYVVKNGMSYQVLLYPDYTFSQTFNETAVPVKTLHAQNDMFEAAVINRANPANFSFTVPLTGAAHAPLLMELALYPTQQASLETVDLYVENSDGVFKLQKSVIETATVQMPIKGIITLSFSGTAQLLRTTQQTVPTPISPVVGQQNYAVNTALDARLNGSPIDGVTSVTFEVNNDVEWLDNATVQKAFIPEYAFATYTVPEAFVVRGRIISGTIQYYSTRESAQQRDRQDYSTKMPLTVKAGNVGIGYNRVELDLPSVVFTNRVDPQEIYIQSIDFRLNSNIYNTAASRYLQVR